MIINIQDDILKIQSTGFLDRLLVDKTTKKNIMWATDAYKERGKKYFRNEEITMDLITGSNSDVIKTRARKAMEQQSERTKQHAEVFTPLWICNKMNNHIDEVWFGRDGAFNTDGVPTERVEFPQDKTWQDYVDSRRLEITCGEAPYLVSRYDVATGEMIPIRKRIGILDRKLRVISENAKDEAEWIQWAVRAFQATYGYEFQGDNVLIARVNLLMSFEEYLAERWERKPVFDEYRELTNVIAWNLWQMDGLTGKIPYVQPDEENQQMDLFEYFQISQSDDEMLQKEIEKQPNCRIFDWRNLKKSIEFISLRRET